MNRKALVIGCAGQIGVELSVKLISELGVENVWLSDIRKPEAKEIENAQFMILDALDKQAIETLVKANEISEIYLLAAALSAVAEKKPLFSWELNVQSLLNVLEIAKEEPVEKVFWPSSIAVFGPDSPSENTPQNCIMNPSTVYGISKLAGERWCEYYYQNFNVDVRSLRFPGILGYKSDPGGGTTDYALWALKNAAENTNYTSFLSPDSELPMMHMDDAVEAIWKIMSVSAEKIKIRSSYNLAAASFSPKELEKEIQKHSPDFELLYAPDFRQNIAASWPSSIDDSAARKDWSWSEKFNFENLIADVIQGFKKSSQPETI